MNPCIKFSFLSCLVFTNAAHAGFFDELNKAANVIRKAGDAIPNSGANTGSNSPTSSSSVSGNNNNLLLPMDLAAYPRAVLYKRIDNPFDSLQMPISTPIGTPDGYVAQYSVPVEGKVTMLQFSHRSDDSPLLIKQHYESWLAQNGFERLLVCDAPCNKLPSQYHWVQAVDPGKRLDSNYLPQNPTYIAAYRNDAMVLVGIGKHIFNHSSIVKVVEGRVLDPQPWKTLTTPRNAPPAVAPSRPAAGLQVRTPQPTGLQPAAATGSAAQLPSGPSGQAAGANVELVEANQLATRLTQSKGVVVVHFSSNDQGCRFCIQSNSRFEILSQVKTGNAQFMRVTWNPYMQAFDDPLAVQYSIVGLPTFITFKDGKMVKRVDGDHTAVELSNGLLRGL